MSTVEIRAATFADAERLFEWRNDPVTRAMFKNSDLVKWDQHVTWLTARLAQEKPQLFVAEIDGEPVGTFRLNEDEISYTIAPCKRGKGYASRMLQEAVKSHGQLRAEIFRRNIRSIRAAKRANLIIVWLD